MKLGTAEILEALQAADRVSRASSSPDELMPAVSRADAAILSSLAYRLAEELTPPPLQHRPSENDDRNFWATMERLTHGRRAPYKHIVEHYGFSNEGDARTAVTRWRKECERKIVENGVEFWRRAVAIRRAREEQAANIILIAQVLMRLLANKPHAQVADRDAQATG